MTAGVNCFSFGMEDPPLSKMQLKQGSTSAGSTATAYMPHSRKPAFCHAKWEDTALSVLLCWSRQGEAL